MRQAIDQLGVKGSVLVIRRGRPWLRYATANKVDTSYLINSVQKSMTATMVMREVQKHNLKLTTKLSKFYPNIPGSDKITIANLLNMTSGLDLKKGQELGSYVFTSDEDNLKQDIDKTTFNENKLGKWHYTSVNYVYLCGILSQIEKKSYEQLFRSTFIKPLGLKNTEFLWANKADLQDSNWVPGYIERNGQIKRVNHDRAVRDAHNELGAGSIVMSNDDLAKTIQNILSGNLLTDKSRSILFKGQPPRYYNGGFYNGKKFKKANGAGEGYYTFLRTNNDGSDIVIIQANQTSAGEFSQLKEKISIIMSIIMR